MSHQGKLHATAGAIFFGRTPMDVRVGRTGDLEWAVWLDEKLVALFSWVGEALDYAEMLGCSPRARADAKALA